MSGGKRLIDPLESVPWKGGSRAGDLSLELVGMGENGGLFRNSRHARWLVRGWLRRQRGFEGKLCRAPRSRWAVVRCCVSSSGN